MLTVHTVAELRAQVSRWKQARERVAFVPTMGNLHAGHLQLIDRARSVAPRTVASVFVNPLQFGPNEDFDRYPRTLPDDRARLEAAGCDLLFAPDVAEMYPRGREQLTTVSVPGLNAVLDGAFRPGHFDGVATVVSLLFQQVQPDVAIFGEKDWQQLQVIRRMVGDLHMPIEILGQPTARDPDGLAMSSRNQYLSAEERRVAPEIHRTLVAVTDDLRSGRRDYEALEQAASARLVAAGFVPQYVEIRAPNLSRPTPDAGEWVVLAAAFLGRTRLIDNRYLCL
jgi:pantoate--beta-alanine ligase